MLPLFTTFRNAMNSKNAIPRPTNTISVVPVAAGCCSAFALAIVILPESLSCCDGFDVYAWHRHALLQFSLQLGYQIIEALLKSVAVAIGATPDPQCVFASAGVPDRYHPEAHVNHVEDEPEPQAHQHHSRPHRPLSGLVRDL